MLSKGLIFIFLCCDLWRDIRVRQDVTGFTSIGGVHAVKPVLDLANNMRMVLVPGKNAADIENFLIWKLIWLVDNNKALFTLSYINI